MKQIKVNPSNEPFYSKEFVRGFNLGAQRQFEADNADIPTWIPCSERMPDKYGKYLVTSLVSDSLWVEVNVWDDEAQRWCWVGHVLAWMPLPEPWKGKDND